MTSSLIGSGLITRPGSYSYKLSFCVSIFIRPIFAPTKYHYQIHHFPFSLNLSLLLLFLHRFLFDIRSYPSSSQLAFFTFLTGSSCAHLFHQAQFVSLRFDRTNLVYHSFTSPPFVIFPFRY